MRARVGVEISTEKKELKNLEMLQRNHILKAKKPRSASALLESS